MCFNRNAFDYIILHIFLPWAGSILRTYSLSPKSLVLEKKIWIYKFLKTENLIKVCRIFLYTTNKMLWAYLKYIPVLLQHRNYCKAIKYEILYFFPSKRKRYWSEKALLPIARGKQVLPTYVGWGLKNGLDGKGVVHIWRSSSKFSEIAITSWLFLTY